MTYKKPQPLSCKERAELAFLRRVNRALISALTKINEGR